MGDKNGERLPNKHGDKSAVESGKAVIATHRSCWSNAEMDKNDQKKRIPSKVSTIFVAH